MTSRVSSPARVLFRFNKLDVPDSITANGVYDTKTSTTTFENSQDYLKFLALKSNLDRYKNIFS